MNETKAAKDCETIQLIQSQCTHQRRDFISKGGDGVMRCLDCGKIFYGREPKEEQ